MVNPLAWDKGLVLAQCGGCEEWHKLRDEASLIDVRPLRLDQLCLCCGLLYVGVPAECMSQQLDRR